MARVRRTKRVVTIGGRKIPVSRGNVAVLVRDAFVEATTTQLRVLAEETRELIIDRVYAAKPQRPGVAIVERPRPLRSPPKRRADIVDVGPMVRGRKPLKHKPLTRRWVLRKAFRQEDGRKLIQTGLLVNGLEVFRGVQNKLPYYIVRPLVDVHGKISLRLLWMVHEFGSRRARVPARPTWVPVAFQVADMMNASPYRQRLKAKALRASIRRLRAA